MIMNYDRTLTQWFDAMTRWYSDGAGASGCRQRCVRVVVASPSIHRVISACLVRLGDDVLQCSVGCKRPGRRGQQRLSMQDAHAHQRYRLVSARCCYPYATLVRQPPARLSVYITIYIYTRVYIYNYIYMRYLLVRPQHV